MAGKVKDAVHKGRAILSVWWPDGLRSRIRFVSDEDGRKKRLQMELSFLDGTWETVRAALLNGERSKTADPLSFCAMAQEYYDAWVSTHNKSAPAKKSFLDRFKERFRGIPPRAFRVINADGYVCFRKGEGVSNATINRELACLRHMFAWAARRGYVDRNPLELLELLEEQEWAGPKPTEEIVAAVFGKLDPRFVPVYTLIRETGARRGEVLNLQHWQIDRGQRLIIFAKRTKNGKNTVAPLTQRALDAIDSVPILQGCDFVFYNPETRTRWSDARKPWVAARTAAGYPWLRVRDLRPAFATEASELGAPMHFIQSALGHGSVAVTERHYAKYGPESAAKQLLRVIEGGRNGKVTGTATGTTGD